MQKGKGSTASPPAGAGRGQPPSQRGPTPPNRGQDDYSSRNSQGYQPQGGMQQMIFSQSMMQQNPQQGQPRGMPQYYERMPTRPMRMPPQQTPNHQMFPSPSPTVGVRQMFSGNPSPFGMSPQYAQVDYQALPVASQPVFRGPGQQVSGPYSTVPYPGYSTSASMPPSMYPPQSLMLLRNPQIHQNIVPQQSFQPSRQEQQPAPPRKKNIIQIKDPDQDNKDVTEEILSQPASTITSDSGSPSLASETKISGNSSALNMPSHDLSKHNESGPITTARAAVTITDPNDSIKKTKPSNTQVATPGQTAKSTSPKTMHPDVKIISIKNTRTVEKDAKKEENKVDVAKPLVKTASEDVNQVKKASDIAATATTVVDGAKVSTEAKEKDSAEVKTENQINSNTAKPSISNEIVPPSAPVDSKVTTQENEDIAIDIAPSKKLESKPKEKLGLEPQEQTKAHNVNLPNGSISPLTVNEIVKENTQGPEMVPSVKDVPNSDIKVLKQQEISKVEAATVDVADMPSIVSTQEDETVNGVESESRAKQTAVPPSATSELAMKEQPKRKKMNKRLKEMDKKPDKADLMDAFTEAPPKEEVKEEPKESIKETTKEEQEEKAGSEEETWEDKDEKSEEGLWSPEDEAEESKNGPRFYDRDFLLQFQFNPICTEKPDDLPDIEVVLQNPVIHRPQLKQPYPRLGGGGGVDFMMPSYMRPQRGQGQSNQSMTRSNKGRMPAKKVIHTSIEQKVELNKSENRWKRPAEVIKTLSEDEKKHEEIIRKFRGILNKLTPQKFSTLIQQVLELEIDTPERLEEVINIIFEKAISEPSFSVAYANMCRCLVTTNVKVETKDGKDTTITFRKILLNKCQKEFEKEKSDEIDIHKKMEELLKEGLSEEELKLKKDELALEEQKGRRRTLGNIRFIGELFKLKMLTESIMHDCIIKLLKSNDEESYECLCKLLSTIGKDLDHQKAKPRMDQYFEQMKKIIEIKKTSSRCRFMLQDVIELRASNWVPRRDDNNPKTIDQIHKEAAEEERKVMLLIQNTKMPPNKRDNPGKGRDSPRSVNEETWTTVPGRQRNVSVDPKKFQDVKKRTNVDTENISLGPGGRGYGAWSRGSSGGSGPASGPSTPTEEPRGNRFSALGGEGRRGPVASRQGTGAGRQEPRSQGSTGRRPTSEREKAMEAVRNIVQTKQPAKPDEQQTAEPEEEEEEIEVEQETRPPTAPSPPTSKELTEEEVEAKATGLIDEYHNIKDLEEAINCVKDINTPERHFKLVYIALNHSMEKHSSERVLTAMLMHALLKNKIITEESYIKGLEEVLEFAEDMEIDIPHIWNYLGEMTGTTIIDNVLSLTSLNKSIEKHVKDKEKAAKLMAEVLISARSRTDPAEIDQLWSQSGLFFSNFFPSKEEELQFLKSNKLESLASDCNTTSLQSSKPHASKVQEELRNLILVEKCNNEDVFKWIDDNVNDPKDPKFIRTLVAVVCEGCKKDDDSCDIIFKQRSPLLQKYIDNNRSLELQALFSLQALSVSLDHPPGFLKSFFNALYDEEIISEDAFFDWEKDDSPNESQGKGTAKSSTVHFFEWLRSAEEEKPGES